MADRALLSAENEESKKNNNETNNTAKPKPKPKGAAATYVIQIPKDQIYRVPPPQNKELFEKYSKRGSRNRGSCCCRCLMWSIIAFLFLLLSLAIAAIVLFLVMKPELPVYTIEQFNILNFSNFTEASVLSPEFDITIKAVNPNRKISLYYDEGSDIVASYSNVKLVHGSWPVFYQPTKTVSVFKVLLKGSGVKLSKGLFKELKKQQKGRKVPLKLDLIVPFRVKFGAVTTMRIYVKAGCDLEVDKLEVDSKIAWKRCEILFSNKPNRMVF